MPVIEDAALDRELERFEKDRQWIYDHYEELKRRYPHGFVAVYEAKVVGHHSEADQLVEKLGRSLGDRVSE